MSVDDKKGATPPEQDETVDHGISTEALGIGAHGDVEDADDPVAIPVSPEALGIGVPGGGN